MKLKVMMRGGEALELSASEGVSVMEIIRDGGVMELLALCGGCCSCATCHVHVDPKFADSLPPMSEDENDLLESASDRDGYSRLSCQIPFVVALDGMTVTIAVGD